MLLNCTNWLYIWFSNSWSHIDFRSPLSTFLFTPYVMAFINFCGITFLCSTRYKCLIIYWIWYILYGPFSMNSAPRNNFTIIIMENTCCYNITTTTNNTRIIISNLFMSMLCFGTDNSKFINTVFTLIHFFIISFIFSSLNRFYMRCTIATFIISIREFRLIKDLAF